jgi:hypothetical protein
MVAPSGKPNVKLGGRKEGREEGREGGGEEGKERNQREGTINNKTKHFKYFSSNKNHNTAILIFIPYHR